MKKLGWLWCAMGLWLWMTLSSQGLEMIHMKKGDFISQEAAWGDVVSDKPDLVSLEDGKVFAKNYGHARLKSRQTGQALFDVLVFDGLALSPDPWILDLKEERLLKPSLQPAIDYPASFTYFSQNEGVVTVDAKGKVKAVGLGETIVEIHCLDEIFKLPVTVEDKPDFQFPNAIMTLAPQTSRSLSYQLGYGVSRKDIQWKSLNPGIVSVDDQGVVYGQKKGWAKIVAKVFEMEYPLMVNVVSQVENLTLSPESLVLDPGQSQDIIATLWPLGVQDSSLIWSSSKPSVATVTNGHVEAKQPGQTTITARLNDLVAKVEVTVRVTLERIEVSPKSLVLTPNQRVPLTLFKIPADAAEDLRPVYFSSDPHVAAVDVYGYVSGRGVGQAYIFVQVQNFTATIPVRVVSEEGENQKKLMMGRAKDQRVSFDTRGIDSLKDYWLVVPYIMSNKIPYDVAVDLTDDILNPTRLNVEGILLSRQYKGVDVRLSFYNEEKTLLSQYLVTNYPDDQETLFVENYYVESSFDNLKGGMYELNLGRTMGPMDRLSIRLSNHQKGDVVNLYQSQVGTNRLRAVSGRGLVVDDRQMVTLEGLKAQRYYLSSQDLESPFYIFVYLLSTLLLVALGSIIIRGLVVKARRKEEKERVYYESVNYLQQEGQRHRRDFES